MAKLYYSLDYTHQELEELLAFLESLHEDDRITLTREEYKKVLADLETQTELSPEEQELVVKLNSVVDTIAQLNPTKLQN